MKRLFLVSGIFSLLLVNFALVYADQEILESAGKSDVKNTEAVIVEPAGTPTEKSEFSAMESDNKSAIKAEKIPSDDYDYMPSSWSEVY